MRRPVWQRPSRGARRGTVGRPATGGNVPFMAGDPGGVRRRLLVSGRVQGVAFRHFAVVEATRLGLRGWVRNLRDGRVEALAEGPPAAIEAFQTWCRAGPPAAEVDRVEAADEPLGPPELGPFGRAGTV